MPNIAMNDLERLGIFYLEPIRSVQLIENGQSAPGRKFFTGKPIGEATLRQAIKLALQDGEFPALRLRDARNNFSICLNETKASVYILIIRIEEALEESKRARKEYDIAMQNADKALRRAEETKNRAEELLKQLDAHQ